MRRELRLGSRQSIARQRSTIDLAFARIAAVTSSLPHQQCAALTHLPFLLPAHTIGALWKADCSVFLVLQIGYARIGGTLRGRGLLPHLAKVGLASLVAGAAGWGAAQGLGVAVGHAGTVARLVETLGALAAGGVAYLAACRLLNVAELETMAAIVRRRLGRSRA